MTAEQASDCIEFWFHAESEPYWFEKNQDFDQRVSDRLGALAEAAARGELDFWQETAEGCLALVLLLDQAPRNLYRGSDRAYAQDARARMVARRALHRGFDLQLPANQRAFLYLPFEHSEDLADQYLSVALFGALPDRKYVPWAIAHLELIQRYGRFPHRNANLGRESTEEEEIYLAQEGAGF